MKSILDHIPKETLYTKILLWTHDKQVSGFRLIDIKNEFNLNKEQEEWVRKIFKTISDNDRKFFELLKTSKAEDGNTYDYYSLNEKGLSAAVHYQALKQAEVSGERALWFSGIALFITAIGLFLNIFGIYLQNKQTKLTEIQAIPEQISQAKAKQRAIAFCKENPKALDSGLYYLDGTGRIAPCSETLSLDE